MFEASRLGTLGIDNSSEVCCSCGLIHISISAVTDSPSGYGRGDRAEWHPVSLERKSRVCRVQQRLCFPIVGEMDTDPASSKTV